MEFYSRRGFFDSALVHAKTEVALQGQDQSAIRRLGILAYNSDSLDLAEEQFNTLLSIGDRDMSSHFFLGRIFLRKGNHEYALLNFRKVTVVADSLADGWLGLASVYLDLDSLEQAITVYEEGLQKVSDPGDLLRLYFSVGAAYERDDDFPSAEQAFLGALSIDSMHAPTLNYLGFMLAERNERIPYAKELIRRALLMSPGNGAYLDSYAWALYQEGDYQQALDSLLRASEQIPDDPTILDHVGDAYNKLGNSDSAEVYWRRALEVDSGDTTLQNNIKSKLEQ
jgi:tetratricopeptide (TPR) repeat protein